MQYQNVLIVLIGAVLLGGLYLARDTSSEQTVKRKSEREISSTPEHARYLIDEYYYRLFDGEYTRSTEQGAEEVQRLALYGEPAYGDIDGDGDDDAFVVLEQETDEGETLYRVAFAVYEKGGEFKGTNTIALERGADVDETNITDGQAQLTYHVHTRRNTASSAEEAVYTKHFDFDDERYVIKEVAPEVNE